MCKQVHLLLTDLCQYYAMPLPDELASIESYLDSKVGGLGVLTGQPVTRTGSAGNAGEV